MAEHDPERLPIIEAHEVVAAMLRGGVSLVPGAGLLSELAGLGVLVAGRLDRMRQTAREVALATGGDTETLVERVQQSESVEVLVLEALDAAARTAMEAKRIALGRLVARAVLDDAEVDTAQLMVAALGELEAVHVRALERLRRAQEGAEDERQAADAVTALSNEEPEPVRQTLIRTGVVRLRFGGSWAFNVDIGGVTEFGLGMLDDLRNAASGASWSDEAPDLHRDT